MRAPTIPTTDPLLLSLAVSCAPVIICQWRHPLPCRVAVPSTVIALASMASHHPHQRALGGDPTSARPPPSLSHPCLPLSLLSLSLHLSLPCAVEESLAAAGLAPWYEATSSGSSRTSPTSVLPDGPFHLTVIRQLRRERRLSDALRDSYGSALRLLPDAQEAAAPTNFRVLMRRLRARQCTLLVHLSDSVGRQHSGLVLQPPPRASVFIVEVEPVDDGCCWLLPYRCLELLVAPRPSALRRLDRRLPPWL